jgi:hypothetical protein
MPGMMSIIIDNYGLYRQNPLRSDVRTLVGSNKRDFYYRKGQGLGKIYWAVRDMLMLSRGQEPGLHPLYFNVPNKWN